MSAPDGFYTMKGYSLLSDSIVTSAMEDYLEMMARINHAGNSIRVVELSTHLHVKASSVTKMIQRLVKAGFVQAQKYGEIELTERGIVLGNYLLYRHDILHQFLCILNNSENELEQVEKIEHSLNDKTIENLAKLVEQLRNNHTNTKHEFC